MKKSISAALGIKTIELLLIEPERVRSGVADRVSAGLEFETALRCSSGDTEKAVEWACLGYHQALEWVF